MIERHVTFEVFSDKTQEFEQLFVEEYRPAMASMPGFVSVHLLVEDASPNIYQMVIRFIALRKPRPGEHLLSIKRFSLN